jgi:hypothetical protein
MADTEYTALQIAEICNSLNWRLLEERADGRVGSGILRRYIENEVDMTKVQWDAILAYLLTLTTVTDPWAEKKKHTGVFRAGPVDLVQDGKSERWRMVHTLYRAAGYTVSAYLAEDGCQAKVYRYFYVDQATVPAHPATPATGSGVGWQSNFQQDRDTLLFSGWWERSERVYQTIAEHTATADAFSTVKRTKHLGVRAGDKDESGNSVDIPDPATALAGTKISITRSKNADCTQDVEVDKQTAEPATQAAFTSEKTAFATQSTERKWNADSVPDAAAVGERIDGRLNDLEKYDYTKNTTTPTPATQAAFTSEKTAFATQSTERKWNADSVPDAAAVGVRIDGRLNDLEKYDYTKNTTTPEAAAVPEYVSELDERVKVTTERKWNEDTVPDATPGQRVRATLNDLEKFDWERTAEAPVTGLVGSTESYSLLGGTYSVDTYDEWNLDTPIYPYGPDRPIKYYRYPSGVYRMQAKYVYTMKYHATRAEALAEIDGAQEGSRFEKICAGCWMSVKITRDDVTLSTKSFPDPHGHLH